jgi:hypothetical protein
LLSASTGKDWATLDNTPGADAGNPQLEERQRKFQKHLTDVILSENLIVLTGLGTSMSVKGPDGKPLAPTMGDLWNAAKLKAATKFEKVKTAVSYAPEQGKENIEHLLSRCQMSERLRPDRDVGTFISDTEEIIVAKCRFVDEGLSLKTHEAFLRKIARRSTRLPRLKLFTTNYDLCFEAAASRTRFVVIDGFSCRRSSTAVTLATTWLSAERIGKFPITSRTSFISTSCTGPWTGAVLIAKSRKRRSRTSHSSSTRVKASSSCPTTSRSWN